jgi:hypothetical protein
MKTDPPSRLDDARKSQLRHRAEHQIALETLGDVSALYEMVDPNIRRQRAKRFDFEPEHTISQIRQFVEDVHSARITDLEITAFAADGGAEREHRPTAIVTIKVIYNDRQAPSFFRTPWVLDNDEWYTTAIGKFGLPGT